MYKYTIVINWLILNSEDKDRYEICKKHLSICSVIVRSMSWMSIQFRRCMMRFPRFRLSKRHFETSVWLRNIRSILTKILNWSVPTPVIYSIVWLLLGFKDLKWCHLNTWFHKRTMNTFKLTFPSRNITISNLTEIFFVSISWRSSTYSLDWICSQGQIFVFSVSTSCQMCSQKSYQQVCKILELFSLRKIKWVLFLPWCNFINPYFLK